MRKITKITAVCLGVTLACSGIVFAAGEGNEPKTNLTEKIKTEVSSGSFGINSLLDTDSVEKEETVYVISDKDGKVQKVLVNELLKNTDKSDTLIDSTNLKDIKNIKSDASFSTVNDNIEWKAQGNEICYRGTSDSDLPINVTASYTLDGKKINASEAEGKSGVLEITYSFTNTLKKTETVDGKDCEIYVPFAIVSGMILNDSCSNVRIDNGRVINDGNKCLVVGYALSGLEESLNLNASFLPKSITIKADVKEYKPVTALFAATNSIFNSLNISFDDKDIKAVIEKLTDGLAALSNGIGQLYDGVGKLSEGAKELKEGVATASSYADTLKDGAKELDTGLNRAYTTGIKALSDGLSTLSSNSSDLKNGATQVFESLIATAQKELNNAGLDALGLKIPTLTVSNYEASLKAIAASITPEAVNAIASSAAKQEVTRQVEANTAAITSQVTAAVNQEYTKNVRAGVLAAMNLTEAAFETLGEAQKAQINAAINAKLAELKNEINAVISQKVKETKENLITQNMNSKEVKDKISAAVNSALSGKQKLLDAVTSLNSYKQFYDGLCKYTEGVDSANAGAKQLSGSFGKDVLGGSKKLSDGLSEYSAAMKTMNEKVPALSDGISELSKGALALKDGFSELTGKITDVLKSVDDVKPLLDKLKLTFDFSKEYGSFGGKLKDMSGSTKFIFRL